MGAETETVSITQKLAGQRERSPEGRARGRVPEPARVLRFDRQGHLITRFPPPAAGQEHTLNLNLLPQATLEQGAIVFRKEGQPDLVARVNADSSVVGSVACTWQADASGCQ